MSNFTPDWGADAFQYAEKYFKRYAKYMRPVMDLDDLMQDAYILFVKVQSREFESDAHFLHTWRKVLRRRMVINMRYCVKRQTNHLPKSIPGKDSTNVILDWNEIPEPVKLLINGALISEKKWRCQRYKKDNKLRRRKTTNEYMCAIAGISPEVPLRRIFETWLYG